MYKRQVYEDGTYGGSTYDWLHEIAKYTGWKYEFVTGSATELLNGMCTVSYTHLAAWAAAWSSSLRGR